MLMEESAVRKENVNPSPVSSSCKSFTAQTTTVSEDELIRDALKDVNSVSDATVSTRKRALQRLADVLTSPAAVQGLSQAGRNTIANAVLKPVLKRFSDPVERCRELAVRIMTACVQHTTDIQPWLPYLLPVLALRLSPPHRSQPASSEPTEAGSKTSTKPVTDGHIESEELRVLLMQLLQAVVQHIVRSNTSTVFANQPAGDDTKQDQPQSSPEPTALVVPARYNDERIAEEEAQERARQIEIARIQLWTPHLHHIVGPLLPAVCDPCADVLVLAAEVVMLLAQQLAQPMRAYSTIVCRAIMVRKII